MNYLENLSDISVHYFAILRKYASKYDLTLSQSLILLYIPFDGINISDISNKLGLDISTMTRNLMRIEKRGFLYRKHSNYDKRSYKIYLSDKGVKQTNVLRVELGEKIQTIFDKLDLFDQDQIANLLEGLGWNLFLYRNQQK